jgi:SAM-dependent methyltransferase
MSEEWGETGNDEGSGTTATIPTPSVPVQLDGEALCAGVEEAPPVPAPAPAPPVTAGTFGRAWRRLTSAIGNELDGRSRLWVLEAGAGTRTLFDLPEDTYIVGVNRDGETLERNLRLDERVATDLAEYRPWAAGFDLITCWYVLDEMPGPAAVLDRFAHWTAPGGLVVLSVPNLRSPRGLSARLLRRTRLRRALTPQALRRRFAAHGFTPICQVFYEDTEQAAWRRRVGLTRKRWTFAQAAVRVLSCGLLDAARTEYIAVFRRHS